MLSFDNLPLAALINKAFFWSVTRTAFAKPCDTQLDCARMDSQ